MQPVMLTWVGGEHAFRLGLGHLRAVQQACDAGPEEIVERLLGRRWRVDDLREPIRQGLIGGGMDNARASALVDREMERHPLAEFRMTALGVMAAAISGVPDDPVGEPARETPPAESGASPKSTAPAP